MNTRLADERLHRLQTALQDAPFDWLLLTRPESVFYATGFGSVSADLFRDYASAVLLSSNDLWFIAPVAESGPALADGVVAPDRYIPFGQFFFESADGTHSAAGLAGQHSGLGEAVAAGLQSLGEGLLLGVDARARRLLGAQLSGQRSVDADAWMEELRAVKLPGEIERLTKAARLAEEGIDAAIASARVGITEQELAAIVTTTMSEGGGLPRFAVVASGERSAFADVRPTDRALKPGDLLRFDVGCVFDGYWSDLGRTAVVGDPTPKQAAYYDAILAGEEAQIAALAPGVTAGQLFDIAKETVEAHGLAPYRRHHCGHAIGTEVYEQPIVAPGVNTPLREGMTFCLETPYYELGWGGMMVEDLVVVEAQGAEVLSRSDRSLRVVPA